MLILRPLAAADYFLRNRLLGWFATRIMGAIAIRRGGSGRVSGWLDEDPLRDCSSALSRGEILIFYPEGTRGEPEQLGPFKMSLAHLMKKHPEVPVYPIRLQGFGRVLPKGSWMLRLHSCRDVVPKATSEPTGPFVGWPALPPRQPPRAPLGHWHDDRTNAGQ